MKEFYATHPELLERYLGMVELEKQGEDIRSRHVRCRNRSEGDWGNLWETGGQK